MHNSQSEQKRTFNQRLRTIAASALCVLAIATTPAALAGNGNNGNGNGNQGQGNQGNGSQGQGNQGNQGNRANHGKPPPHHVSPDLNTAIHAPTVASANSRWARNGSRGVLVQVIITADNSGDRMLTALRKAILQAGGS